MSATLAPFGFRPAYNPIGLERPKLYTILTGYAGGSLYKGNPVALNTDGTLRISVAGSDIIGIFDGVEYIDATGKPVVSNFWPSGTTATNIRAWVLDDPTTVFEVQATGSIAQAAIGDQANTSATSTYTCVDGSTSTGLGSCGLSSSLAGAGSQGQFRIVGFGGGLDNAVGDTYTVVQVQIAQHEYVSDKTAI